MYLVVGIRLLALQPGERITRPALLSIEVAALIAGMVYFKSSLSAYISVNLR